MKDIFMLRYFISLSIVFLYTGCHQNDDRSLSHDSIDTVAPLTFVVESKGDLNERYVTPEHQVVLDLENDEVHHNDTADVGSDSFVVNIESDHIRTFCFADDGNISHRLLIQDGDDQVLLDLASGCQSVVLKEGKYRYTIENGSDIIHTVFLLPKYEYSLRGTRKTDGNIVSIPSVSRSSDISRNIQETQNLQKTIISFHACVGCNLNNIDLSHKAFSEDFHDSTVSLRLQDDYLNSLGYTSIDEFFEEQNRDDDEYGNSKTRDNLNLENASMQGANLSYSVFKNANFNGVDFTDANLSHAVFHNCSFKGATFSNTDMTQTVFWAPSGFGRELEYYSTIISRPTLTTLYRNGGDIPDFDLVAAIDETYRVVVFYTWGNRYTVLPKLPNGISIVSPAEIATNNFDGGFSVFVKGSDGAIYEYLDYGSYIHGPHLPRNKQWHKISSTQNVCSSDPSVYYDNMGGSMEVKILLACRGKGDIFPRWHRYFYSKYNTDRDSCYGSGCSGSTEAYKSWTKYNFLITGLGQEISVNKQDEVASINDTDRLILKSFHYGSNDYNKVLESLSGYFASEVALDKHRSRKVAFLGDNGTVITVDWDGDSKHTYGQPPNGAVSTPAIGSLISAAKVVVLSGDGNLYTADLGNHWSKLGSYANTPLKKEFIFKQNHLYATYFYQTDLSGVLDGTNHYDKTFFDDLPFSNNRFDGAMLDQVEFFSSHADQGTTFKGSKLHNVTFRFSSLTSVDFSQSHFEGAIWRNSRFQCVKFDYVRFSDDPVISQDNTFKCRPDLKATFKHAENIPVELIGQFNVDTIGSQNPEFLGGFDFSSASFKNLKDMSFKDANMENIKFGGIDTKAGVDISGINAPNSTWKRSDLSYVICNNGNFNGAHLDHTSFYQAQMDGTSFVGSFWASVNASYARFQNSNMKQLYVDSDSSLRSASLAHSDLQKATLAYVNLKNASFINTDLSCSDLRSIQLSGATSFNNAYLSGVDLSRNNSDKIEGDFSYVDFSGANFSTVTFGSSNLFKATFDFSGNDVIYDIDGDSCQGHTLKPVTTSDTTCPDGSKYNSGCNL